MSEISRGVDVSESVSRADGSGFQNAHSGVEEPANDGFIINIGVARRDFHYRIFSDFIRRQYTKLNPDDSGSRNTVVCNNF